MQNDNLKFKIIFLFLGILFFSGCVQNVDLRREAAESKAQEQKKAAPTDARHAMSTARTANVQAERPAKILFVGDMMFDRHVREAVAKYGKDDYNYVFELLKDKLSGYDLVVGNLEGPITDNKSVSASTKIGEGKNLVFTFDPVVANVLFENNIRLVNLGNNHILNQGEEGLVRTKEYLDKAGVNHFDGDDFSIREIGGIKVSFVGYNYSESGAEEKTVENIKKAKEESDLVVVLPHWGTEYKTGDPGDSVRALADRFVEAGADVIIGTHPHVIEDSEDYNGKKIYYSLGNFVFDQYFQKETMEGLGVELTIKPDLTMEYNDEKFVMNSKGRTELKSKN